MKTMKRFASVLLALVMAMALTIPAFAATVNNTTEGHTYDAYQVFSGTQADGDATLGDIDWGTGVNGNALLADLQKEYDYFDSCTSAADVADVLKNKSDYCDEAKALAAVAVNNLTNVKTTIVPADSVELAAGYYLLVDTTEGDDDNNSETAFAKNAALLQVTQNGDIDIAQKYDTPEVKKDVDKNDVNIGDTVTFTLTATMPSTFEGYETYKVVFHDTMFKGLTYNEDAEASVDGFTTTTGTNAADDTTITVSCNDVLAQGVKAGDTITVTYTATLNEDAIIGVEGNLNEVYLEYSNDPNWDGDGDEPTGDTPKDEEKVFTWEIPVVKVDGADGTTLLSGAVFTLYRDMATTTPVYVVATATANVYKVCNLPECDEGHEHKTEITTDATGKFEIEGLAKGSYYLKETQAPAGYNLLTDVVTITIGDEGVLSQNGAEATGNTITVENNAGAVLPETGGIGTTIFYALGGILMIGAAVLLITKKRMSVEK